jgi:hypothetical protein
VGKIILSCSGFLPFVGSGDEENEEHEEHEEHEKHERD